MKFRSVALAVIYCGLFFFVSSTMIYPLPPRENVSVSPSTGIAELDALLFWAEKTYFLPNQISLKDVDPQKKHHLENLAVMLGAVLQSQKKHLARGPQYQQAYTKLEISLMAYLAARTSRLEDPEDWRRLWSEFALKGAAGELNEDIKKRSHVDPAQTNIPLLLAPSPEERSPLSLMDEAYSPAPGPEESAVYGHGDMGEEWRKLAFKTGRDDAPSQDKLRQRQEEIEMEIEEHEGLIGDEHLLFANWGPILRPVALGTFVHQLLDMRLRGVQKDVIMDFVSEVLRQTIEYRRTVRERVIPDLRRELRQVREGRQGAAAPGVRHEGGGTVNPQDDPEDNVPWHVVSEADRIISGHWILTLNGKESIIYVTLEDKKSAAFKGILTLDRLQYFTVGDTIFRVFPQPGDAAVFEGTEFGYDAVGAKREALLKLEVRSGKMTYDNGEQELKLHKR